MFIFLYMLSKKNRKIAARIAFFSGLILMLFGISFLFGSIEGTSEISVFVAFSLVAAGAFCAILAIRLNNRSTYLFFASFCMMSGFFLFLLALGIIPLPFSKVWPLLSVFAGLALLPSCWQCYGAFRSGYVVSSCALIILGFVLLAFSLRMVSISFRQFILAYWPLIFVLGGLNLLLISVGAVNRHAPPYVKSAEKAPASDEGENSAPPVTSARRTIESEGSPLVTSTERTIESEGSPLVTSTERTIESEGSPLEHKE